MDEDATSTGASGSLARISGGGITGARKLEKKCKRRELGSKKLGSEYTGLRSIAVRKLILF